MDYSKGGRGRKAPYTSSVCRVPSPLKGIVDALIERFQDLIVSDSYKTLEDSGELWQELIKEDVQQKPVTTNQTLSKEEAIEQANKILKSKKGNKKQQFEKLLQVIYDDEISLD